MAASEPEPGSRSAAIRFLSEEWIAALGELVPAAAGKGGLSLGQIVEGGPDGDVMYTIRLGEAAAGGKRVVAGSVTEADVVLVEDYETARGVASGDLSPSEAIRAGRVKVRGQARSVATHQDLLVELADALADLRSRTTY